jgi:hypothetical protein
VPSTARKMTPGPELEMDCRRLSKEAVNDLAARLRKKLLVRWWWRWLNSGSDRVLPSGRWLIMSLGHYLRSDNLSMRPEVANLRPLP